MMMIADCCWMLKAVSADCCCMALPRAGMRRAVNHARACIQVRVCRQNAPAPSDSRGPCHPNLAPASFKCASFKCAEMLPLSKCDQDKAPT